jgi:hypothetical protein
MLCRMRIAMRLTRSFSLDRLSSAVVAIVLGPQKIHMQSSLWLLFLQTSYPLSSQFLHSNHYEKWSVKFLCCLY